MLLLPANMSGAGCTRKGGLQALQAQSEAQLPELTKWGGPPLPSTSQGGRPPVLLALGAQLAGIIHTARPQAPPRVAQQACLVGSIQVGQAGPGPVQQQSLLGSSLDGHAAPALQAALNKMRCCGQHSGRQGRPWS